MKKRILYAVSVFMLCLCLTGLMIYPAAASRSAVEGLELCAGVIIPSLLPFMVLSGLISALGLPKILSRAAGPLFSALFGVPGHGAAPFILGLTGGYPVGAAAVAELVRSGEISPREGERMLPFVNNTGPAFIIGAAGAGVFGSGAIGLLLYVCHISAALTVGILFSGHGKARPAPSLPKSSSEAPRSLGSALPGCVKSAAGATVGICAFVVFFSVIRGLLEQSGIFTSVSEAVAAVFRLDKRLSRALLSGILELGSGIGALRGLSASPANLAAASFILGFGGLSVHCQTLAVTEELEIKCVRHFAGRLVHGACSAMLTYFFAAIFAFQP